MIKSFAHILQAFMQEEVTKLYEYKLRHGPTIGDMYEGLSAEIIDRAIPPQLGLQVLKGFVHDGLGNLSGQIDCMLVKGEGENIPYTDSFKWHVKDVLAVFEVKKNLFSRELVDSFCHLRTISHSFVDWMFKSKDDSVFDITSSSNAFSKITGVQAPDYKNLGSLPDDLQMIYQTLIIEQLSPIRIVLGYDGYKSEKALRDGLIKFLTEQELGQGFGVLSFPHILTCNGFSLVKLNGQPFFYPIRTEYWEFLGSTGTNPIYLMLEYLWTKISTVFNITIAYDDDLEIDVLNPFMSGKPIGGAGWMLNYLDTKDEFLNDNPKVRDWEPTEVSIHEFSVFNLLCKEDSLNINSQIFNDIVNESKTEKKKFIKNITSTSFVALDGECLKLTTNNCLCAILPTGKFVVAENEDGKLLRYLDKIKNKA